MESGTFAVDPEPWGPPWRSWAEIRPDEAAARGVYAPVAALSNGAPGAIVIAPGDADGTMLMQGHRSGGYCCGIDTADGPNVACATCALPVATRIDDCSLWQATWLAPNAVRRLRVGDAPAPLPWSELVERAEATPPFEPLTTWRAEPAAWRNYSWTWSPRWEAAAGQALAHLLAASEGRPVNVPDGLAGRVFQRALNAFVPAGHQARRAVLAGPEPPLPVSGVLPGHALRDDYDRPAPHPLHLFWIDREVFRHTLARLPAVRSRWCREVLDRVTDRANDGLF